MDVEAQGNHIDELSFHFYIPCLLTYPPFPSAPFLSSFSHTKADNRLTGSLRLWGVRILNVRLHSQYMFPARIVIIQSAGAGFWEMVSVSKVQV